MRRILPLALALLCLAACRGGPTPSAGLVEVRVAGVGLDPEAESPLVLLEEVEGKRSLPIWIGVAEAESIALELAEQELPRPNTHDLAGRLIEGLEGHVERIVVTTLRDGIYFARIELLQDGRHIEIDSRPSDAIAIALRLAAPVFVHETLFEASSRHGEPSGREVRARAPERQVAPTSL